MKPGPRSSFLALSLALAGMAAAQDSHSTPLMIAAEGRAGFALVPPEESGLAFQNHLDDTAGARNRTLYNGSGVAAGDVDGDGLPDLYFCSLDGRNKLYRNLGGWKFEDVTGPAGVECLGRISRGAVLADLNGDGALDLLVGTSGNGVLVFLNDGHGRFRDFSKEAGTTSRHASVTMALADVNGDGLLDLYVANNRREDFRDEGQVQLLEVEGKLRVPEYLQSRFLIDASGQLQEYGEPDQLYLGDGAGRFTPVPWSEGAFLDEDGKPLAGPPLDWGLTATFRDLDGDGAPDLYVCNDYWTPDRIWMNDGHGRFQAAPRLAWRSTSASSMGVDFADIDRDGHPEAFVVDMLSRDHQRRKMQMGAMQPTPLTIGEIDTRPQIMRNTLQRNRGDGTFEEIAYMAGLAASEWAWQPIFLDVDLDGFEDVLVSAGHYRDVQDTDASNKIKELQSTGMLVPSDPFSSATPDRQANFTAELLAMANLRPRLESPIVAFRNDGKLHFEGMEEEWGTAQLGVHHGLAVADFDGDGALDFVVNNLNAPAGLYRNTSNAPRVSVRLRGLSGNTQGIGAKVRLLGGAVPMQSQEMVSGGRYLSGCDAELMFAAGQASDGMTLEVTWRSGKKSTLDAIAANRRYVIDERGAVEAKPAPVEKPAPLFTDASALLGHTHHENEFDDFKDQLLLPNRLSQLGPGLAWQDFGSGENLLVIGAGHGGSPALFSNLKPREALPVVARDLSALVLWKERADAPPLALVGFASFEDPNSSHPAVTPLEVGPGAAEIPPIPDNGSSTGPICMADVDGDGELDLFVGGRVVPGRYPEPASSRLFLRRGDQFVASELNETLFKNIGLVSGAVFSDLEGNGRPDLILALEWGPVRVFHNDGKGQFSDATEKLGLAKFTGWWNGVTTGDLDGDGCLDIIATNWGRNSKYEGHYDAEHPLLIYYGDFNGTGEVDVIESHYDHAMGKLVPERGLSCSSTAMPFIKKITPTYQAFGGAGLGDIYGEHLKDARRVSATTLDSMVFFNRGAHFDAVPMPPAAQVAPAFGVNVADFDGDGNDDVFIAQNFFAAQIETPRNDAGRGLLLRGDGKGGLAPMSGSLSGIEVYGDARGSAVGDYDGDGRVDLVVAQNGARTKLFHNTGARPGLRVRLVGAPGNAMAIGAQMRLISGGERGALREIHGGSGYWSQDGAVQIFSTTPREPEAVWVRWPGGEEQTAVIPAGAKEVTIKADGGGARGGPGNDP